MEGDLGNFHGIVIEIQIIRNSLEQQSGKVRWVDHSGMYADCLTKRNGNAPLMQALMKTVIICLTEESLTLEKHKTDPKTKGSSKKSKREVEVKRLTNTTEPSTCSATSESKKSLLVENQVF